MEGRGEPGSTTKTVVSSVTSTVSLIFFVGPKPVILILAFEMESGTGMVWMNLFIKHVDSGAAPSAGAAVKRVKARLGESLEQVDLPGDVDSARLWGVESK